MLVMSDDSISDTGENCYKCFGIVVPDDLKHLYIEKLLNNYHGSSSDANWIYGARHMMNFRFRTAVRVNLGQMTSHQITKILWSVGETFFDILHSMTIDDMNANDEITDDMLIYHNHMTERMLGRLSKADNVKEFIDKNRDLRRHKFDLDCLYSNDIISNTLLTDLPTYLSKLSTTQISCFIQTGSKDFLDRMFVIKNDEIKDSSRYDCFGIVLPNNLIQQYIERWFNGLTEADSVRYYMSNNRPLKNITFRSSVRTYMRELNTKQITALIQDGNDDFLNKMFVMTDASIVDNLDNLCECFGIVVPVESVQHYVEKLFHRLVNTNRVKEFLNVGRHLMDNTFLTAMCSYVQQLNQCDIVCLIKNGTSDFLNTMFVMTEDDIKNNGANRYECFGIVIPDDMLQLFVQRLFDFFTKSKRVTEFMNNSRLLMNVDFRTAMCSYMRQLNNDSIFSLMQTVDGDFLSRMFVITEEDIECNAGKLYECIGIVIPGDLLQHYVKRWFHHLIKTNQVQKFMNNSRTFINITFRTALRTYMRQLSTLEMDYLIQTVSEIFFENFFEMSKNDSNDSDENPYDILPYYIERWFERLTKDKSPKDFMNKSSHLKNDTIRIALHSYIEQLSTEK
ncbi:unnamed protein product [Mytilus edulis]|uniref:Uncharacterized protein n=1 Tax=Mytilus edulis TaxID=6550 RepID=A0A8S3QPE6_MYTED|nr:unnamed protein product [Mytilus edulis]